MRSGDLLSIIEAAYFEAESVEAWIRHALAAVRPCIDAGHGVIGFPYVHDTSGVRVGPLLAMGEDAVHAGALGETMQAISRVVPASLVRKMFPLVPMLARPTELLPREGWPEPVAQTAERLDIGDAIGVVAGDPSGHGCILYARDATSRPISPHRRAVWSRVAAHLVTGYRLARRRTETPDAVLDAAGRVLHREPDVVPSDAAALAHAARSMDLARGKLRRVDPDRALHLWQGLVAGRWSLVDHFDHDGRRFVIAKRNGLEQRPWSSLTEREADVTAYLAQGQTLKLIAYQLGVSVGTVAGDLARARAKLGVRSRLELVTAYRARRGQRRRA